MIDDKPIHKAYDDVRTRLRAKDSTAFDHLWLTMSDLYKDGYTLGLTDRELLTTTEALGILKILVLRFQYESLGYGRYRCRSCGSLMERDEFTDTAKPEACSAVCPWEKAKRLLDTP